MRAGAAAHRAGVAATRATRWRPDRCGCGVVCAHCRALVCVECGDLAPRGPRAPIGGDGPTIPARSGFSGRPCRGICDPGCQRRSRTTTRSSVFRGRRPTRRSRTAFRKLARKHHPDVNQGDKARRRTGSRRSTRPTRSSAIPRSARSTTSSDRAGRSTSSGSAPANRARTHSAATISSATGPCHPTSSRACSATVRPFSDFFQQFFGGEQDAPDRIDPSGRRRVVRRGQDVEGDAEISLEDAYTGSALTVDLSSADGPRRVEVKIPAGIHDGARVRATGQGSAGRGGGPRGDLFIRVHIRPPRIVHTHRQRSRPFACRRRSRPRSPEARCRSRRCEARRRNSRSRPGLRTARGCGSAGSGCRTCMASGAGDLLATVDVRLPHPVPEDLVAWAKAQQAPPPADPVAVYPTVSGCSQCDPGDGADVSLAGRRDDVDDHQAGAGRPASSTSTATGSVSSAHDRGPGPSSDGGSALTLTWTGGPCGEIEVHAAEVDVGGEAHASCPERRSAAFAPCD